MSELFYIVALLLCGVAMGYIFAQIRQLQLRNKKQNTP